MQGQAPQAPYVGLWSRLVGFQAEELSRLLLDRRAVRIAVMRNTVHLVTAADALALRPLTQVIFDRDLRTNATHTPKIGGLDLAAVTAVARELVEERPRSTKDLGSLLQQRWPDRDPSALAFVARNTLPMVQVPPRGLWRRSGQPTLTTTDAWLGRPLTAPDVTSMVTRYLGAFGPATVQDAQAWSGLTRLREVFERLQLMRLRDDQGRELFDLPDAPRPDEETPAPVRFLAEFDNLILSHADRTRVIARADWQTMMDSRLAPRTVLVDGYVRATWKITEQRGAADLLIEPLGSIGRRDCAATKSAIEREGAALLAFAVPKAQATAVRFSA
ncbi:winged helix DNA-binding domain-containing protein [Micromonospora sp. CPCC 205371]|nr:winged helix DNA-binding domain-containing protein [Micromonospora sp. CPCC 205371]